MKIYFIDRNVLSLIKESNLRKPQSDKNKLNLLKKLRIIDRKQSIITPMLSVMEGKYRRLQTTELEIKEVLDEELLALEKFFQKAVIDRNLNKLQDSLIFGLLSNDYQEKINKEIDFLNIINVFIYQPANSKDKKIFRDKILEIANQHELQKTSPVVFSSLLCLYGNDICREILKSKKNILENHYYNAIMDFKYFSTFLMLASQIRPKYHSEFITGDKNLSKFFEYFDFINVQSGLYPDGFWINFKLDESKFKKLPIELREIYQQI